MADVNWSEWNGTLAGYWFLIEEARRKAMHETSPCRACGQAMLWVMMLETNRRNPLNPEPAEDGNIELLEYGKARVVPPAERPGKTLYLSHFATCPEAHKFKKAKP